MIGKIGHTQANNIAFKAKLNINGTEMKPSWEKRLHKKAESIGSNSDSVDVFVLQPSGFVNSFSDTMSQDGSHEIGKKFIPSVVSYSANIDGKKYSGVVSNPDDDFLAFDYDAISKALNAIKGEIEK